MKKGFTLIELLIVIAIILILIAIALPNFLEAQTRAKVTNAKAEMRGIAPAIQSYFNDWRRYPPDGFELPSASGYFPEENPRIWTQLTTPVQYVTSLPVDEFHVALSDSQGNTRSEKNQTYRYYGAHWRCLALGGSPGRFEESCQGIGNRWESEFEGGWIIYSPGPDKEHSFGEWSMHIYEGRNKGYPLMYAPTNGTRSKGDLVYWGN
ncbi:MAG: prepilin-type N-terminal cleavage/methylation domain-containing protein [Candidatus Omnitrophica bacterium]|nr:prepilin-type N-terminal cleavage/methylation domain-containing protein [Candidatus Omnitrophota bacterium]MCA9416167.1 prepilin-type N-terminal cleavage/methylation domain-containing protein [Candidatus Omnitrophota bacterium]MCA9432513.1 prepilin-type N-terminal cleavage/methylation domain-containing protein [Candidatus Omnitrophota bacterium]MCA9437654.1 prepilin-type N-terminal cleavage/methylation domain-containing protein [Candidatus Omnitrophota bacterium]MCA9446009.1 prepilin-type N-